MQTYLGGDVETPDEESFSKARFTASRNRVRELEEKIERLESDRVELAARARDAEQLGYGAAGKVVNLPGVNTVDYPLFEEHAKQVVSFLFATKPESTLSYHPGIG